MEKIASYQYESDLEEIERLVEQKKYDSASQFIRSAVREKLERETNN